VSSTRSSIIAGADLFRESFVKVSFANLSSPQCVKLL